jgi:hypothetical protein
MLMAVTMNAGRWYKNDWQEKPEVLGKITFSMSFYAP